MAKQLAWSPDGKLLAVASYEIELYEAQSWKQKRKLDTGGWSGGVAFLAGWRASGGGGRGQGMGTQYRYTGGEVVSFANVPDAGRLAFSSDGKRLAVILGVVVRLLDVQSGPRVGHARR